jgi:multicomponent Na+:H+ antiporter subunit F
MTEAMLWIIDIGAVLALVIAGARLIAGPTQADRVVALDVMFSATIALTASMAMASGWPLFLDLGLGLAAVGFVATLVWARLIDQSPRGRS